MKLMHLIVIAAAVPVGYVSVIVLHTPSTEATAEAVQATDEPSGNGIPTPDQIWEQRYGNRAAIASAAADSSPSSQVVPKALREQEERFMAGRDTHFSDEPDIPPMDPRFPDEQAAQIDLPAVAAEIEAVPASLQALESQPHPASSIDPMQDVPMMGDPNDYLQPDELPSELPELEVMPQGD